MKNRLIVLVIVSLLCAALSVNAQDAAENPLLAMLRFVPDSVPTREFAVYYVDYRAAESVVPDVVPPQSVEDVVERFETDPTFQDWSMSVISLPAAPQELAYTLRRGMDRATLEANGPLGIEQMDAILGFNTLDIDRSLFFGQPPQMGLVLGGDFDPESIAAAYTARAYTEQNLSGLTVWCYEEGCEEYADYHRDKIDLANIFGGRLGRQETLLVTPDYLMDSSAYALISVAAETINGERLSLGDAQEYRAAAEAIFSTGGTVIQAIVMNPRETLTFSLDSFIMSLAASGQIPDEDTLDALLEPYSNIKPLPPYVLLVTADVLDGTDRVTLIGLVYFREEDAQAAGDAIPGRIDQYVSLEWNLPLNEVLANRADAINVLPVYTNEAGYAVALIELRMHQPARDTDNWTTYIQGGSLPVILRGFVNRDLGWLASTITLPGE